MRGLCVGGGVVMAAVASIAIAGASTAATQPWDTIVATRDSGRLVVTFTGSSAAGCAADGLCDVRGTITIKPFGRESLFVPREPLETLGGPGQISVSARVQRVQAGKVAGTCTAGGILDAEPGVTVTGGTATITLRTGNDQLLTSDCAGPLEQDIAGALPRVRVPLAKLLSGRGRIDLGGSAKFSAGGLAGTARSTIAVALGKPRNQYPPTGPGTTTTGSSAARRVLTEQLRLVGVNGGVAGTFTANPELCAEIDACGASGRFALHPHYTGVVATVGVGGPATLTETQLLAALRGGVLPTGANFDGEFQFAGAGVVDSSITQSGTTCRGTATLGSGVVQFGAPNPTFPDGTRLPPAIVNSPTRNRCPGPDLTFDGGVHFTRGSLAGKTFTVQVIDPKVNDQSYDVKANGTITLTFAPGAVTQKLYPATG